MKRSLSLPEGIYIEGSIGAEVNGYAPQRVYTLPGLCPDGGQREFPKARPNETPPAEGSGPTRIHQRVVLSRLRLHCKWFSRERKGVRALAAAF